MTGGYTRCMGLALLAMGIGGTVQSEEIVAGQSMTDNGMGTALREAKSLIETADADTSKSIGIKADEQNISESHPVISSWQGQGIAQGWAPRTTQTIDMIRGKPSDEVPQPTPSPYIPPDTQPFDFSNFPEEDRIPAADLLPSSERNTPSSAHVPAGSAPAFVEPAGKNWHPPHTGYTPPGGVTGGHIPPPGKGENAEDCYVAEPGMSKSAKYTAGRVKNPPIFIDPIPSGPNQQTAWTWNATVSYYTN